MQDFKGTLNCAPRSQFGGGWQSAVAHTNPSHTHSGGSDMPAFETYSNM